MKNREKLLDLIYDSDLDEKDYAAIIRQVYRALDDSFYEDAPSAKQQDLLKQLLTIADEIEEFYKR